MTLPITVIVAAKNEEKNIARCLRALRPVAHIVLADSQSTDNTATIGTECGAQIVQFDYRGGHPKKRQWVLNTIQIETPWVFFLDADEVVPDELWSEIAGAITATDAPDAFLITKGFHFLGKKFRHGGFSHAAVLLFRNGRARFEHILDEPPTAPDMEIHERLIVDGRIGRLTIPLIHEDFKGLEAYIARHNLYSTWEANVRFQYLTTGRWGEQTIQPNLFGNAQERRRFLKEIALRVPGEPWFWFLYHYVVRLGCLEGRPGLIASRIRADYIAQVRAKLYELRLRRPADG